MLFRSLFEAIAGVWTPEQDNVCDHATNLINKRKDKSKPFLTKRLTARFDVRLAHAFEPVKAGRPIISNAV